MMVWSEGAREHHRFSRSFRTTKKPGARPGFEFIARERGDQK